MRARRVDGSERLEVTHLESSRSERFGSLGEAMSWIRERWAEWDLTKTGDEAGPALIADGHDRSFWTTLDMNALSRRNVLVAGGIAAALVVAIGLAASGALDNGSASTFAGRNPAPLRLATPSAASVVATRATLPPGAGVTALPTASSTPSTPTPTAKPSTPAPTATAAPTAPPTPVPTPAPTPAPGAVWSFGGNGDGQLGDGTTTEKNTPVAVSGGLSGVTSISAPVGGWHSVALKSDGTVWAWGDNAFGQLGSGNNDSTTPVKVDPLSSVTKIAAGRQLSLALIGGEVWAWGSPPFKINDISGVTAIAAGDTPSVALKSDGTVWNLSSVPPAQITGVSGVTAIAAGAEHVLALKGDGTVWAWGLNEFGQCGDDPAKESTKTAPFQVPGLSGITAIAAGARQSMALKSDGSVWMWGQGTSGQLGNGSTNPINPTPAQISGFTGVVAISTGRLHSLALKGDGTVWAWGDNGLGQLGDGSYTSSTVPVQVKLAQSATAKVVGIAASRMHSLLLYGTP